MKSIIFLILIVPLSIFGQVNFNSIPIDKQLVGRDLITNKGEVNISGDIDKSNSLFDFDELKIEIYKGQTLFELDSINHTVINTLINSLNYNGNTAAFNFSIEINSELSNYSFKIYGVKNSIDTYLKTVRDVVAGDVYIIQGQSNAEASMRSGSSNINQSNFIRVFAHGYDNTEWYKDKDNFNHWHIGQGDGVSDSDGNTGQWGLKLARMILDSKQIPVAIFNGARGGSSIIDHVKLYTNPEAGLYASYQQMLYRLFTTGLKNHVRALFWSQGERDGFNNTLTTQEYKDYFLQLKSDWLDDYPNIEKFYIFQTKNSIGCDVITENLMRFKEAQRQLTIENTDIDIMQTAALTHYTDNCHFNYVGGYEEFAIRIYNLVDRDMYGGVSYTADIEPPMITAAYLTDDTTLVVETDAISLTNNATPIVDYALENAGSSTITNIQVSDSNIIFTLSENPGLSATISYYAQETGIGNFITNTEGLELVCFNKYPIEPLNITIWDGSWSNGIPNSTTDAYINANYLATDGNIEAKNLIVNANLNFDNSSTNSVVIHGDLTINNPSIFIVGDTESLVMYKKDAQIIGEITKKENSASRNDTHDMTYWSSPVVNEAIENVFSDSEASRFFYYDQSNSTASDPNDPSGTYWNTWVNFPSGQLIPGVGFATEGKSGSIGVDSREFNGKPNNGDISYTLKGNFGDGDSDNDFNLIGNPYPSALDIDVFLEENSSVIDPTVYLWTHNTPISGGDFVNSDYATYNLSGGVGSGTNPNGTIIPSNNFGSGQGFFVRAINPGSVMFKNTMRLKDLNNQFFKPNVSKINGKINEVRDRIWLNLMTDQGGFSQILIDFTDKATDGFDKGYDASRIDGGNPINFYSQIDDIKYVIQGLPIYDADRAVNLGFDIKVAPRIFTIKIDKTEGLLDNSEVYLVDNLLNTIIDLKLSDYEFEQKTTGDYKNRFTLQFAGSALSVDDLDNENYLTVINDLEGLKIKAFKPVKTIEVYDLLGRLLIKQELNKKSFYLKTENIKIGTVLIIRAVVEDGTVVNKKTIKY